MSTENSTNENFDENPLLELLQSIDPINAQLLFQFFEGILLLFNMRVFLVLIYSFSLDKNVTLNLFHVLAEDELKYIIPPENNLIIYLTFKKNFIQWKRKAEIPFSRASSSASSETTASNTGVLVHINKLVEHIVKNKYQEIEKKMNNAKKNLTPSEIGQLLEYLVQHFMKNKIKMERKDMEKIAKQISVLFPNEDQVYIFFYFLYFYHSRFHHNLTL